MNFFSRAEFCNLLAKNAFSAKKGNPKIEQRQNPCKIIYVSHIFFNIIIAKVQLNISVVLNLYWKILHYKKSSLDFNECFIVRRTFCIRGFTCGPMYYSSKKSLVSRVSSKFEQFPSDCRIIRITKFDANMSICFICEQSISEDEKPVGGKGRQTLLTASVTRGHSDHKNYCWAMKPCVQRTKVFTCS